MPPASLALGFVGESAPCHLISPLFPDKIGGRPAWLALKHLPTPKQLACPVCSNTMVFLLQVYSTIDSKTDCFHRMLFLFMCRNGSCHQDQSDHPSPFIIFRSQLSRENAYYSFQPPETHEPSSSLIDLWIDQDKLPCAEKFNSICPICGCLADKYCARCKRVKYCSKSHQLLDWKNTHRAECPIPSEIATLPRPNFTTNPFLLPEYNLYSEPSSLYSDLDDDSVASDGDEVVENNITEDIAEFHELESVAKKETKAEAQFRKFKQALSEEPDQVVRLSRGGNPLWISSTIPSVPDCEICGDKRIFEFQVTPQLLHYLKLDRLGEATPDFGSLYVFTCASSCALPHQTPSGPDQRTVEYQREFVIRQFVP